MNDSNINSQKCTGNSWYFGSIIFIFIILLFIFFIIPNPGGRCEQYRKLRKSTKLSTQFKKSLKKGKIIKENYSKSNRMGLVCMTRKPLDFKFWLDHHFNQGFEKIYLRVEETPELKDLFTSHPRAADIKVEYHDKVDKTDNWWSKMDRQHDIVTKAIEWARNDGLDWLWHFDDDEIIYSERPIPDILAEVPEQFNNVFAHTIEAVYPEIQNKQCFGTTNKFIDCQKSDKCRAYYGGKSCARLSWPDAGCNGPHQMLGEKFETDEIKILHFESCSYDRWKEKYIHMNHTSKKKIPDGFDFYHNSIKACKSGDENQMKKVYSKYTIDIFDKDNKKPRNWIKVINY